MKPSTREWVAKAEEDFLAACALNRRRKRPLQNVVCFHVQQTVEKYLKARLEEAGQSVPKIHGSAASFESPHARRGALSAYRSAFSLLISYAVQTRYPGNSVTKADAKHAIKLCRQFRKEARQSLGLH